MSPRGEATLWAAHRLSALLLAPMIVVHLATMIVAVQGGLSAEEILARTRAGSAWTIFYGIFVVAACVHGVIGLRTVATEALGLRGAARDVLLALLLLGLLALGLRAVAGVS